MEKELIEQIRVRLKEVVSPKRYEHTMGVVKTAIRLAQRHGADPKAAEIAGLLHDFAKNFSEQELKAYIGQQGLEVDPLLLEAPELLHGKVAAHIAASEFQIENPEVLKAIENHTTGAPVMGLLEKIIYLADYIEPARVFPGVEDLRKLSETHLDQALLAALDSSIRYVLDRGKLLDPNTILARNQLLRELERQGQAGKAFGNRK